MFEVEARKAMRLVRELIGRHGPRLAGSEACLATADELRAQAEAAADRAWTEEFSVHPGAFLGFIRILVVIYLLAALALPFLPFAAALASTLGMLILVLGFILYREVVDPFFPRRRGRNVLAVLEPSGPVRRQLIVSGHHDSARIFNFYVDRPELYARRVYGGIGSYAAVWVASVAVALLPHGFAAALVVALVFLALFVLVAPLWNFASSEGTPGAGDNLAASAVALGLLEHFRSRRDAGSGLEGTRLVFASWDAEEAGLRGARAWARAHGAEVAALPTWNYNMDCLYRAADSRFLTSDVNGSVALSRTAAEACADAARAAGVPAPVEPIAFLTGGTDAAELARIGAKATTLIAMKWNNAERGAGYHTPADTPDAVEPAALELAFDVGARFALALDSGALDG